MFRKATNMSKLT